MTNQYEVQIEDLLHYGVLGMKWGQRKTGTSSQIYGARKRLDVKQQEYQAQKRAVKTTQRGSAARVKQQQKLDTLKVDFLKDPDRVLAARLTRGEKAIVLLGSSISMTLPIGVAGIAATSATSRRIEKKQEDKAYDKTAAALKAKRAKELESIKDPEKIA